MLCLFVAWFGFWVSLVALAVLVVVFLSLDFCVCCGLCIFCLLLAKLIFRFVLFG